MILMRTLVLVFACLWALGSTYGQDSKKTDILKATGFRLDRAEDRAQTVASLRAIEQRQLAVARAKGRALGLKLKVVGPDHRVRELMGFDGDDPIYYITLNANAAISTGADLVNAAPYLLDGANVTVGVWDAGSGLASHQEFATGTRLVSMDGAGLHDHSMHVAGTIAAAGVVSSARGMAVAAHIDSYDWNNEISEMTSRAATAPNQHASHIYLSNHSYGIPGGWDDNEWRGNGTDANAAEYDFGRYTYQSSDLDALAYSAPYYLSVWSAGNDRNDKPSTGANVIISGTTVSYDPALHPPGDGEYRDGFETIGYYALAKNILTVGAVNDAVTSSLRDPAKATLTSFSSTGPTDDGRIKPDVVANGAYLDSTLSSGDTAYGTMSGTSMASPNACGSAALLVQQYYDLFSGGAMRSSTLKGLLIHTADDLGNPGPDYMFGWGLINVAKAAALVADHKSSPSKGRLNQAQVTSAIPSNVYTFDWDGVSPIRATLCWTDPAGAVTSTHDLRNSRLVNDLDLKLVAPDGTEFFPFVMPFVGTWTTASMDLDAINGVNHTDNIEQVLVNSPGQAGSWDAVVTYTGNLNGSSQNYGLLISGTPAGVIADADAPQPDPMTWLAVPAEGDPETEITMTATTATDISGVEYYFTEISGNPGGSDSGWQDSPTYTDTGLSPNQEYTYTVSARDKSTQQNTTVASVPASVLTSGGNQPPSFTSASFVEINAVELIEYSSSIADDASDPELDPMTFSKDLGPDWLIVDPSGALAGTPTSADIGLNEFTVSVSATGGIDTAILKITVEEDLSLVPPSVTFLPATNTFAESAGNVAGSVVLSHAYAGSVTVEHRLATPRGTATAGADFDYTGGVLTLEEGQTSKTFPFSVIDDTEDEQDETIIFELGALSNAVAGATSKLVCTITADTNDWHFIPFYESFEKRVDGDLNGQHGWVSEFAEVQNSDTFDGSLYAGSLTEDNGYMRHSFNDGRTRIWFDVQLKVAHYEASPNPQPDDTVCIFVSTNSQVMVFNGPSEVSTGVMVEEGVWTRFTVFSDYTTETWVLFVNGNRIGRYNFFSGNATGFTDFSVEGNATHIDDLSITTKQPLMPNMPTLLLIK